MFVNFIIVQVLGKNTYRFYQKSFLGTEWSEKYNFVCVVILRYLNVLKHH